MSELLKKLQARTAAWKVETAEARVSLEERLLARCAKKLASEIKARGEIAYLVRFGTPSGEIDPDSFDVTARLLSKTLDELDPEEPKK